MRPPLRFRGVRTNPLKIGFRKWAAFCSCQFNEYMFFVLLYSAMFMAVSGIGCVKSLQFSYAWTATSAHYFDHPLNSLETSFVRGDALSLSLPSLLHLLRSETEHRFYDWAPSTSSWHARTRPNRTLVNDVLISWHLNIWTDNCVLKLIQSVWTTSLLVYLSEIPAHRPAPQAADQNSREPITTTRLRQSW